MTISHLKQTKNYLVRCPCVRLLNVHFEKLTDGRLAAAATYTVAAAVAAAAAAVAAVAAAATVAATVTSACCWRTNREGCSSCSQVFARTAYDGTTTGPCCLPPSTFVRVSRSAFRRVRYSTYVCSNVGCEKELNIA